MFINSLVLLRECFVLFMFCLYYPLNCLDCTDIPNESVLSLPDSAASSVSWRLSPSSSGYKTQSQRSESVTPSPTSTPYMSGDSIRQDSTASVATNTSEQPSPSDEHGSEPAVWVLTDLHNTPKGSVIINPQVLCAIM